ncbi:MAG: 3-phosphoshikimate 1-carboxyvinyltransferase [Lentisphaerae bacterium]|nr:3-phosphoshikimate 1-carboxyvinyltransferase [Lentisphaerota bacterium]
MTLTTTLSPPLRGSYTLPGDKSLAHRAALFAALATGKSVIESFPLSGVTQAMLDALTAFGVEWSYNAGTLYVLGRGIYGLQRPSEPVNCRNSGTTIRLLIGAAAAAGVPCTLDGSEGLRRRPMSRVTEPLQTMGVAITTAANGCAPLVLAARAATTPLKGATIQLPVASAQVKSCLLLAALAAAEPVTITEPGPSRDHTERMLTAMSVTVRHDTTINRVTLTPPLEPLKPLHSKLAGDISTAAFLIVAATIIPGSDITLCGVGVNHTRTGIIEALTAMGADITITPQPDRSGEPVADLHIRHAPLKGITVSGDLVVRMIDEFPIFAIAAAAATGQTIVRDAAELRHKESDRISRLCNELKSIGVTATEHPDGFSIATGAPFGGVVDTHGDHRLAMSLAVAGWISQRGVTVKNADIMTESFPDFTKVALKLGATVKID